ncbi:aldehyde dehydrogenase family protein [Thalassobacillus devorans]|uniref:aldehyde dehydrogenase family protein n=1 Tax=Thalassobacillus devorans TaxID=279813 RepID=UPI001269321C
MALLFTVFEFDGEDEAIRLANDTDYGLITERKRWRSPSDHIRSSQVFINNYGAGGGIHMPYPKKSA